MAGRKPAASSRTHDQECAFLQAILERPDDDTPRLVYADWLEEHGDADRGRFIRVQCELAALPADDPRRPEAQSRQDALLTDDEARWRSALPTFPGVTWDGRWHRGFPETITVSDSAVFHAVAEHIFPVVPVRCLRFKKLTARDSPAVMESPHLARVSWLNLRGCIGIRPPGARALAASAHLARLTTLDLTRNYIGPTGAEALAASPHLTRLTTLELTRNAIETAGAQALAGWPGLATVSRLTLGINKIRTEGIRALAASPHVARLRSLELRLNFHDDEAAEALASSPHLAELCELDLANNQHIKTRGIEALVTSPHLTRLTKLGMHQNYVGDAAVVSLASRPEAARFTHLDLNLNHIGDVGARALADSPYLANLQFLDLGNNLIGDTVRQALRDCFGARVRL
jgi:uncharacterized protein (TIGR02996 family)